MKNIPSFNEFKKYDHLLESSDDLLRKEFNELERLEISYNLNEGSALDSIKSSLSKFFLGPLSKTGMIDETRKIMIDLEIDLIEQKYSIEKEIENINDQISGLSRSSEKEKYTALVKDKESKIKQIETYIKSQRLKIKKCQEHIRNLIGKSERRREYYETGRAEDEITIAEFEYQLAKSEADSSEIRKYEEKIAAARKEAAEKAEKFEDDLKASSEIESEEPVERVDAEKEKKKVSSRRGSDIIKRKNDLQKEIIDLKSDLERKLKTLLKRIEKGNGKASVAYVNKMRIQLLELTSTLDAKVNLLNAFKELGGSEKEITSKVSKETEFSKLASKINSGIVDGQDANTGTKKIIGSVFSTNSKNGTGEVKIEKLKDAIKKIQ
jgi:hypothetical protein